MKELLAAVTLLSIAITTIVLAVKKRIGTGLTAIFLAFSLISSLIFANYDWMEKVRVGTSFLSNTDLRSSSSGEKSSGENQEKVELQASPAAQPSENASEIQGQLENQKKSLESLSELVKKNEEDLKAEERNLKELKQKLEQLKEDAATLHRKSSELALLITRIIWLQLETKDETGSERTEIANQQILDQLDEIVNLAISDPEARSKFVEDVKRTLPPKRQP